jgi:hypothetical protein
MKPGPKPLLGTTMTHAERQARYRASHAEGAPKLRYRKPADRRSRPQRWRDAVAELLERQAEQSSESPSPMRRDGTAFGWRGGCRGRSETDPA